MVSGLFLFLGFLVGDARREEANKEAGERKQWPEAIGRGLLAMVHH